MSDNHVATADVVTGETAPSQTPPTVVADTVPTAVRERSKATSAPRKAKTPASPSKANGKQGKAQKKPAKKGTPKATKTDAKAPKCLCGCGDTTGGGKFRPGHDARLKGVLQRAYREEKLSEKQYNLIAELGWQKYMKADSASKLKADADAAGVTIPQVAILRTLAKAKNGLTRPELTEKMGVSTNLTEHLGPVFKEDIAKVEERSGFKCLLSLRMVSVETRNVDGKDAVYYSVNQAGAKALGKIKGN